MRGDRPFLGLSLMSQSWFTPHARGSTYVEKNIDQVEWVYPACAGIDPPPLISRLAWESLPRMRGDRPTFQHRSE